MRAKFLTALLLVFSSATAFAVDLKLIEQQLATTGCEGWVHGAVPEQGLYVFTYRNPKDFFDYAEMSLVSYDRAVSKQLAALGRHDKIRIKGSFLDNPSPQKHIRVASLETLTAYQPPYEAPHYAYTARIPDELLNQASATFLVHAIGGDGHILVVEYKDAVVPVFVKSGELTKNLYRGDVVQLSFVIQQDPDSPAHLNINETNAQPVKVLESVRALHGKPASVEGALILFPKSPEIIFNVFAVQQELSDGLKRQYTLVNFDSPDTFAKIRALLQKAWDKYPAAFVNGRNKLVSTRIRVKATGTFNEVDPSQANPQILLNSADSIQILEQ